MQEEPGSESTHRSGYLQALQAPKAAIQNAAESCGLQLTSRESLMRTWMKSWSTQPRVTWTKWSIIIISIDNYSINTAYEHCDTKKEKLIRNTRMPS